MIRRTEKFGLAIKHLDMQIFFGEMFEICKKESEIEWLQENLQSYVERAAEEATLELTEEVNDEED